MTAAWKRWLARRLRRWAVALDPPAPTTRGRLETLKILAGEWGYEPEHGRRPPRTRRPERF